MSKYRIIKRTFADGKELFGVQKKWLFIWWNCYHGRAAGLDISTEMFTDIAYARNFINKREGDSWVSDVVVK